MYLALHKIIILILFFKDKYLITLNIYNSYLNEIPECSTVFNELQSII